MINISKLYSGKKSPSDDLRYKKDRPEKPVVVFNCTEKCNLNCRHCYSSSSQLTANHELTTSQAKDMLGDLADFGCPVVLFSGGEPLIRPDIFELLTETVKLKMRCVISTNGTLIDLDTAQRLSDIGVGYVGVSIDGPEEFHDEFRGKRGSFRQAMQGIQSCIAKGVKTGLRFTMTESNAEFVPGVFDIAVNEGIRRICFYHLIRTGRAQMMQSSALTPAKVRQAMDTIIKKTDFYVKKGVLDEVLTVGNHADAAYLLLKMARQGHDRLDEAKRLLLANGGNKIGQNIISIGWDGEVFADQFWRNHSLGNVKFCNFSQIFENDKLLEKLRNRDKYCDLECKNCRFFAFCGGNFRFLGSDPDIANWRNEPACYLSEAEIKNPLIEVS